MIREHAMNDKISRKVFLSRIRAYPSESIEITKHALFRLDERQRKIYQQDILKKIIMEKSPLEIVKQQNGNLAVLYPYESNRILKIVMNLRPQKLYIVTFYILTREQERILE